MARCTCTDRDGKTCPVCGSIGEETGRVILTDGGRRDGQRDDPSADESRDPPDGTPQQPDPQREQHQRDDQQQPHQERGHGGRQPQHNQGQGGRQPQRGQGQGGRQPQHNQGQGGRQPQRGHGQGGQQPPQGQNQPPQQGYQQQGQQPPQGQHQYQQQGQQPPGGGHQAQGDDGIDRRYVLGGIAGVAVLGGAWFFVLDDDDDDPESVIESYADAVLDGDLDEADSYFHEDTPAMRPSEEFDPEFVDEEFFEEWEMRIENMEQVDEDLPYSADDFDNVDEIQVIEVETVVENDPTGFTEPGTTEIDRFVMAKNDAGEWRIWEIR